MFNQAGGLRRLDIFLFVYLVKGDDPGNKLSTTILKNSTSFIVLCYSTVDKSKYKAS